MAESTSWVIGSGSSCDIVIDMSTVSTRHCRITHTAGRYLIEDLSSTNGTFVNGNRISQPTRVECSDSITLGASVPFAWQQLGDPPQTRVIRIGRSADNDVVIDRPNVSTHHCTITITGDVMTIEDVGSTNGTAVGRVDNKVQSAPISLNDVIYLGTLRIPVSQLVPDVTQPDQTADFVTARNPAFRYLPIALLCLVVLLFVVVVAKFRPQNDHAPSETGVAATAHNATTVEKLADASTAAGARTKQVDPAPKSMSTPPTKPIALIDNASRALFWIVVSDADRKQAFRVGTGWAIDPHHIVTTGSVVTAMTELNDKGLPNSEAFWPAEAKRLPIIRRRLHPEFEQTVAATRECKAEYEDLLAQLRTPTDATDKGERLKAKLLDLRDRGFTALQQQVYHDVGIVTVERDIAPCLSLASDTASMRPKRKLHICGLPFDAEDPYFDPQNEAHPLILDVRIHRVASFAQDNKPPFHLLIECDHLPPDMNLIGSPILDAEGKVLAMYSRPAVPKPGVTESRVNTISAVMGEAVNAVLDSAK